MSARLLLAAAALYAAAAVAVTWPLFRHPATTVLDAASLYGDASIFVQRDVNLTMWVLAWDAHSLTTDPLHLFDANALYPARHTLALSEHMLGNVPWFAPVYLPTRNPVLAHQATLLASFVLAGLAMAAYVLYWTRDRAAAFAAGLLYAFAPFRLWQLGNLHVIAIQYLPLVALAIDTTLDRRGGRAAAAGLGLALIASILCSYYVGYTAVVLAGIYLGGALVARGRGALARLPALVAALAAAAAVVAALSVPYLRLQQSGVIPDYGQSGFTGMAFGGMARFGPIGMLDWFVRPRMDGIPQFLTYTAMVLAAVGVAGHRAHPRGALVAIAVGGVLLFWGPDLHTPWTRPIPLPYRALAALVPGFSALRVPQRFGALTTLAVMALAGLGLAALRATCRRRGRTALRALLPWLAVAAVLLEATPRGLRALRMPVGETVPAEYRWLAAHGEGGPLLELPSDPKDLHRQSLYLYFSTFHWLPTANGYTPYPPRSSVEIMDAAVRLPAPEALEALLRTVRLRWMLFHRDALPAGRRAWEVTLRARLRPVAEFGDALLFEVPG